MSGYPALSYAREARRRATLQRTRRFALVGAAIAAIGLLIGTAVTFTAENATNAVTITASSASVGTVTTRGSALPGGTAPPTKWVSDNVGTGVAPVWTPILNVAVSVTTLGDIALIDTRGLGNTNVLITLAISNAAAIDASHNYFILPVDLKVWNNAGLAWQFANSANSDGNPLAGGTALTTQYLSTTNGYLQFTVDGGGVYELSIPTGGSIYAVNTTTLSPSFLVTTTLA